MRGLGDSVGFAVQGSLCDLVCDISKLLLYFVDSKVAINFKNSCLIFYHEKNLSIRLIQWFLIT